jgi:hypothetical protein
MKARRLAHHWAASAAGLEDRHESSAAAHDGDRRHSAHRGPLPGDLAHGRNYPAVKQILGSPLVAVLLILMSRQRDHMKIGIQVVIEDYVYTRSKFTL